jgi:GNAT superfamily N-acetyltransferase
MKAPSKPAPVLRDRRSPSEASRTVRLQGTRSWALRVARALRDWHLLYYRSIWVLRCDRLDDTSAGSRTDFKVIEANAADIPKLAPLQGGSISEWLARMANGHTCLIARSESGDLGYMWVTRGLHYMEEVDHVLDVSHDSKAAYLHDAYVLPAARNQGIFSALMDSAKVWARARGLSTLYAAVAKDNEISRRALLSAGFTERVGQVTLLRVGKREWKRVLRTSGKVDVLT